ncbi:restriction endonuclease subunit S [Aquifex pyrophilus]
MTKVSFYREKDFKNTEIGEIPREWEVKKVKDVLKFTSSVNGIKEKEIHKKGKYPVINQGKEFIVGFSDEEKFLINENLPMLIFGDHTCEIKYIDFPFIVAGEGVKLLKPVNSLNELYFFYVLENFKPKPQHYRRHFKLLKDVYIPLPPLPEQKAIAKVLKDFDDLIEVIEEKIKTLQRIKKGLMDVYFTRGVFDHKEFKDTEIGKIPKEWKVERLKGIGKIITGKTPSTGVREYWNGNIMFVTPTDYKGKKYIKETDRYVTEKGAAQATLIPPFSVLTVCIASIGEVTINVKPCITNQQINAIVPFEDKIYYEFLYYIMKHRAKYLKLIAGLTTTPIVKKSTFENLPIPLPPLEEQKAIAQRLKTIDDQIENLKSQKETLQRIKKKFMDLLLTGKVRVKNDV